MDDAKDAARYRWLKRNCIAVEPGSREGPDYRYLVFAGSMKGPDGKYYADWRFSVHHEGLDKAIDMEMERQVNDA